MVFQTGDLWSGQKLTPTSLPMPDGGMYMHEEGVSCKQPQPHKASTPRRGGVWTFPKAQAFWHLAAALRLFGRCVSLALRRVVGAWPCSVCVSVV